MQNSSLNLLVLRCQDIERSRAFYENLGLTFIPEKHGSGPQHYSTVIGSAVLELYPAKTPATAIRFGIGLRDVVAAVASVRASGGQVVTDQGESALLRDPDSNLVELTTVTP